MVRDRIEAKNNLECYISSSKNSLENPEVKIKLGEEKYAEVYTKLCEIIEWTEASEETSGINKEDYDKKYKELEDYLVPVFKNLLG